MKKLFALFKEYALPIVVLAIGAIAIAVVLTPSTPAKANVVKTYQGAVSFTVNCDTTFTGIPAATATLSSYQVALALFSNRPFSRIKCANNTANAVFFGGAGVAAAAPHNCIANTGCARADFEETVKPGLIGCIAPVAQAIGCIAYE